MCGEKTELSKIYSQRNMHCNHNYYITGIKAHTKMDYYLIIEGYILKCDFSSFAVLYTESRVDDINMNFPLNNFPLFEIDMLKCGRSVIKAN